MTGSPAGPKVIDRRVVQLADPVVSESSQPYHAALDMPKAEGAKTVARLVKVVELFAGRSLTVLIDSYRTGGHKLRGAGIVVGSEVDPSTIKNDHIRAHAEEGRLFRTVTVDGLRDCGLKPTVTVEKELFAKASNVLRVPEGQLKQKLTALGREVGGPWRAEEKAAALAAWIELA
jgi:hypothetical protein